MHTFNEAEAAMASYEVTYIDAAGSEVRQETIEYDLTLHESYPHIIPEAVIKLVIDAPEFGSSPSGALAGHIGEGYLETVVIDARTLLVCHEDFMRKLEDGDWGLNTHPKVLLCAKSYGARAAVAYGRPDWQTYPFAGPIVLVQEQA